MPSLQLVARYSIATKRIFHSTNAKKANLTSPGPYRNSVHTECFFIIIIFLMVYAW